MSFSRLLLAIGCVLSCGWLYFYVQPTFRLITAVVNNEPYYVDIVAFFLLPYVIAPFVFASYIEGTKRTLPTRRLLVQQWFTFSLLLGLALLLLLDFFTFGAAFISTFSTLELSIEWLWLALPIGFLIALVLLARFLYKTRHSLKPVKINTQSHLT